VLRKGHPGRDSRPAGPGNRAENNEVSFVSFFVIININSLKCVREKGEGELSVYLIFVFCVYLNER